MSIFTRSSIICAVVLFYNLAYSQNKVSLNLYNNYLKEITIVGNIHHGNQKITADSLYDYVKKITPDLLLTEVLTTKTKIPIPIKIGLYLGFIHYTIDYIAEKKFVENDTLLKILPFDVEMDRIKYLREKVRNERKMWGSINRFINSKEITVQQKNIFLKFISVDSFLNKNIDTEDLHGLNKRNVSDSVEKRMEILNADILPIVKKEKTISKWANYLETDIKFWDYRNKKMAENIISILKTENNKKRIVILCGLYHKYYLEKLLAPLANANNFKLLDLK